MRSISVLVAGLLVAGAQAAATPSQWLTPPVDAPIVRHFAAPTSQYGPGHRGVDYGVSQGTRVRAAGSGVVTFAGVVAGVTAVTINHGGGVSSTYTRLQAVEVVRGQHVTRGGYIGVAGEAHPGEAGLHFGVKVDGAYVDPESMLGPIGAAEAIHLAPTGRTQRAALASSCSRPAPIGDHPPSPDHNIAVEVAGIGSSTKDGRTPRIYATGPTTLGYPDRLVYRFSYLGTRGRNLHRPYPPQATYRDIRRSARALAHLLERIARRHPGAMSI